VLLIIASEEIRGRFHAAIETHNAHGGMAGMQGALDDINTIR